MKIVWIVNHVLKPVAEELGLPITASGSWIQSLLEKIVERNEIELYVIIPSKIDKKIRISDVTYILLESNNIDRFIKPTQKFEKKIRSELNKIQPDLIHIHGTEFAYYHSIISVNNIYPVLISIQGLVSEIVKINRFDSYVLRTEFNRSNVIKNINLFLDIKTKKYVNSFRAKSEIKLIQNVENIIGRTNWDESHVKFLNPNLNYYSVQEMMRKEFYNYSWNKLNVDNQIIFAAGGFSNPLKGFHFILFAFFELLKDFPHAVLKVVGENPLKKEHQSSYEKYLVDIINKLNLVNNIIFLGYLNANKMAETFSTSSVYVMASSIENSSNTLGEALTIGTPCIVPFVGGNSTIVKDNESALFYNYADVAQLVNKIKFAFNEKEIMESISNCGKKCSMEMYDCDKIINKTLNIYRLISEN